MSDKYESIDSAICKHIILGRGHASNSARLEQMARNVIEAGIGGNHPSPVAWRLIDRRMQAMRKSGRIEYDKMTRKWVVLASTPTTED